jgi:hypothetical protein
MAVFLKEPQPHGFGWSAYAVSGAYGTPIVSHFSSLYVAFLIDYQVAIFIGEILGRYMNDWIMNFSIRRNKGVFEAENRLW